MIVAGLNTVVTTTTLLTRDGTAKLRCPGARINGPPAAEQIPWHADEQDGADHIHQRPQEMRHGVHVYGPVWRLPSSLGEESRGGAAKFGFRIQNIR